MSKKKGSGNTMTLKDFHGGSIPTDLPLPSAPGVIVRPSDRPGYDRPNPWGNPMGRPDHRSRPHSSPATRHFDDKTPFLTHAAHIGRNFDEDERKPLDGVSAPRRTISDDNIRVPSARVELKPEYGSSGNFSSRQGLGGGGSGSGSGSGNVNSYAGKVNEVGSVVGVSSQNLGGNSGGYTNVWAARKEAMGVNEPVQQAALAGQNAVSKFAHASALDKVSSGRWQSKQPAPYQGDVEAARSPERESGFQSKNFGGSGGGYDSVDVVSGREYHDATLARQAERGLNIEDGVRVGRKEIPDYERAGAPVYSELKERNPVIHVDRTQLARNDGKLGGSELHSPVPLEPSERPKLKLLPRTKPLESSEQPVPVVDHTQGYQRVSDTAHAETVNEVYGNMSPAKPSIASTESVKQAVERPKLNLKPRSQPPEHLEGNAERERNMLFGGARPRELVLKERGVDDVGINNLDLVQQSDRVEQNVPRTERVHGHAIPARHSEKTENSHLDQMTGKRYERKDHRQDSERVDMQRRNWRNESRRNNNRETERQQQQPQQPQQQVERPPSPDTWRKPVEQPKPASPDAGGLRYGKAASAVELAQAFSKSVSDPKIADQFSGQKALPGRTQMPFSRLTGPTPRPQINGY